MKKKELITQSTTNTPLLNANEIIKKTENAPENFISAHICNKNSTTTATEKCKSILKPGKGKREKNSPSKQKKSLKIKKADNDEKFISKPLTGCQEHQTSIKDFIKTKPKASVKNSSDDDDVLCLGENIPDFNYHGKILFTNCIIGSKQWLSYGHINAFQSLMYDKYRFMVLVVLFIQLNF